MIHPARLADDSGRIRYPTLSKKLRKRTTLVTAVGIILFGFVVFTHIFHKFSGSDTPKCRSIYMYPSYARIDGFDHRHTKLAKKYHIYLYREQGKDREPIHGEEIQLDGIPVLFIPGNAGSFKQARSIAAASANIYFDRRSSLQNSHSKNMDYFTADFNEDLTAFHGQSMLDQAVYLNDAVRYILSLYSQSSVYKESQRPLPKSVILLGHSMGGIVARLMPTLPNHVPESVNTMLTLSSPHAVPPVTFDGDILKLYDRINSFWGTSMSDADSFFRNNMSVISLTGGILDDILPADYTSVKSTIPATNGFSTFTTTIPEVWTPIDHLAIVWCDQLRHVIAKYLLEIVNDLTESKTLNLSARMKLGRKFFLSGLETATNADKLAGTSSGIPLFDYDNFTSVPQEQLLELNSPELFTKEYRFDVFKSVDSRFELLTSLTNYKVFFCNDKLGKSCINGLFSFSKVPHSSDGLRFPTDSSWGESIPPFRFISLDSSVLHDFEMIVLQSSEGTKKDFVLAKYSNETSEQVITDGLWRLSFFPSKITLQDSTSFIRTLSFPNLWSSLISFTLETYFLNPKDNKFKPFLRQFVNSTFETKWHLLDPSTSHEINTHNISPFIPVEDTDDKSLELMFFIPPGEEIRLELSVNWKLTLKMLYIRFRLAILSFPISIIALVSSYQFYYYRSPDSKFISFDAALVNILNNHGIILLLFLAVSPFIINNKIILSLLSILDSLLLGKHRVHSQYLENNYILGLRETFAWWLGPLFFVISVALLFLILRIINVLEFAVIKVSSTVTSRSGVMPSVTNNAAQKFFFSFNSRQIIGICLISLGVMFYIPYQFAFIIVSSVQIWNCMKLAILTNENVTDYSNLHNYNVSFLLLTIFMIPINVPIVVVFLRNFAIRWETAFRSHHNFLAIIPTLLLILKNSQCKIPLIKNKFNWILTISILGYLSFYSLIHGMRSIFWVFHIYNILNGVLFLFTIL
ncbi:unnamed protein product [Kluyveromyces dobzhanskii CBS 2104]|uniref:GPI inositol-deacylase n=1 Tax=Kluyveromyces dobzhanskii CBS 2104 TaxID=1427455 RepID=A0A0A8LDP8_9SACH|nr:unnamed protein product [Kluyveromyces dobzhanskii CBS 2104]